MIPSMWTWSSTLGMEAMYASFVAAMDRRRSARAATGRAFSTSVIVVEASCLVKLTRNRDQQKQLKKIVAVLRLNF